MTYAGARGKTASEMCDVLGFCPVGLNFNVHATFGVTLAFLNSPQARYKLAIANGIFANVRFSMFSTYTNLLSQFYSAGFKSLDFNNDANGSADYINKWVETRTKKKIKKLVSATQVRGSPLVLVNAIYFKGEWMRKFKDGVSTPFHVSNTDTISVKMMSQTAMFRYGVNQHLQCQILELPYDGHRVSMYILLPTATEGLASLESKLTFSAVTSALAKLRRRRLSVGIPKFEINKDLNLKSILHSMGMKLMFSQSADFTGISSVRPLFVRYVIHKAFISVNETGTEAAAATAVIFWKSATRPVRAQFLADHPFLFLIRDQMTGSILFLGRYVK